MPREPSFIHPVPLLWQLLSPLKRGRPGWRRMGRECSDCCCSEISGKEQMLSVRVQRCQGRRASVKWLQLAAGRTEASTKSSCPGNLKCEVGWCLNLNATLPCPGHA